MKELHVPKNVIDFHNHVGEWQEYQRIEAEEDFSIVLSVMDRCNIRVIVQFLGGSPEEEENNRSAFELAKRYPDRIIPFAGINPNYDDDITARLQRYLAEGNIRGIKLHPTCYKSAVTEPVYEKIFAFAHKHSLMVLSHTWHKSPECDPKLFVEISRSFPGVPIVLGHSGGTEKMGAVEAAKQSDDLYLELCTSFTHQGALEEMVAEIGDDRILFGSDMPFIDPRTTMGWIIGADIPEESKENIFYNNGKALLEKQTQS
jgi:uncharacterized protein